MTTEKASREHTLPGLTFSQLEGKDRRDALGRRHFGVIRIPPGKMKSQVLDPQISQGFCSFIPTTTTQNIMFLRLFSQIYFVGHNVVPKNLVSADQPTSVQQIEALPNEPYSVSSLLHNKFESISYPNLVSTIYAPTLHDPSL